MLIKFVDAGISHTYQCDMVSTEVIEHGYRVRAFNGGTEVKDAIISQSDLPLAVYDTKYQRAYVMEGGVTVDTIK
ncbi:MAG: hypothetical protein ACRCXB_24585 [Aeromonadaceae bacterium]